MAAESRLYHVTTPPAGHRPATSPYTGEEGRLWRVHSAGTLRQFGLFASGGALFTAEKCRKRAGGCGVQYCCHHRRGRCLHRPAPHSGLSWRSRWPRKARGQIHPSVMALACTFDDVAPTTRLGGRLIAAPTAEARGVSVRAACGGVSGRGWPGGGSVPSGKTDFQRRRGPKGPSPFLLGGRPRTPPGRRG